ncbi:hypothetical protein SH449x_004537 [Pirellulaceae bacterium SH449]
MNYRTSFFLGCFVVSIGFGCKPAPDTNTELPVAEIPTRESDSSRASKMPPSTESQSVSAERTKHEFENYEFELPSRFKPNAIPQNSLPPNLRMAVFSSLGANGEPEAAISMLQNSSVAGGSDMKRNLITFFAGLTNKFGVEDVDIEDEKVIDWHGLSVTQINLRIIFQGNKISGGSLYGFESDSKTVLIGHIGYEGDPAVSTAEMNQALQTFRIKSK